MLFQKRRRQPENKKETSHSERKPTPIPDGLMNKCPQCADIQYTKEIAKNSKVCGRCQYHFKLSALERIELIFDQGSFSEYDQTMTSGDPLGFPQYSEKLSQHKHKSGLNEAVVTGEGTIEGIKIVAAIMSFDFFAGTMGSVVGEKLTRAIETATDQQLPLVIFSTSGGARMQESILCLMQMAKTSGAIARYQERGGFYISVITDPTYGGVSASFAMLGDVILAEPGAAFGFAGRIVIEQTIRQRLADDFQKSEFHLAHGQLDAVVHRNQLRKSLFQILDLHQYQQRSV